MSLGERYVSIRWFSTECRDSVGEEFVLEFARDEFLWGVKRDREAIVAFDHTIKQSTHVDYMRAGIVVRTEAYVIRAQLAIEGPKEKSNGRS
ncbi:hypothetical protein FGG39_gp69 [Mycobacterium phage Saintus]|uniref:Uncharacterized protein n=1 Tax=Mycobacterium phage Saintus TaxID=2923007 RepID=G8IRB6_9CAUD|nr:hypothetical protein FGG39_gp69 [Mycobacterium phage Saintus]AER26417.1 hypothetical protein SAINTUS_33 [Mycobacterium phage Saintus]